MPFRQIKVPGEDGAPIDGLEVPVRESNEKWSEYTLEDGTVIRAKLNVFAFIRLIDKFDAEGNPLYGMKATTSHVIVTCPDDLQRRVQ